jgi:hypothetical protein
MVFILVTMNLAAVAAAAALVDDAHVRDLSILARIGLEVMKRFG